MARRINAAGLSLIKKFEGLRLKAYKCPAGVWTIGYGHTGDVKPGQSITSHQADVILEYDLEKYSEAVDEVTAKLKLNDNQFAALVCLTFNIGIGAFRNSTLLKKVQAKDFEAAGEQFLRWCKAGGKVLEGLRKRRVEERSLFLRPPSDQV